jgi:hypothetical protein
MKSRILSALLALGVSSMVMYSCSKDTPAPTAEIFSTIEGYKVTFTPQVTNTDTYSWDFGDGTAVGTEANPIHTYESFGEYTVKLTVTGAGGVFNTNKVIKIEATSLKDLLTGGKSATDGKTWVMSTAYAPGKDGGGTVTNDMPVLQPSAENVLTMFGLGDEYDNEYTFYYDGSYRINLKNSKALAGAVYGAVTQTMVGDPAYSIGMCAASYTVPATSTWAIHTEDFTVDAITDPNTTDVPPVHGNVTFTGKNWVSFSSGAYFGILDFPQTPRIIIKEISSDKMNVAMFLCGYGYGEDPAMMVLPTNLIHMTFVKK